MVTLADPTHEARTEDVPSRHEARRTRHELEGVALVVAWCREEPGRIGEVLLPSPGRAAHFGRGAGEAGDTTPRLHLLRQRPGARDTRPPLRCRRISRDQLRVQVLRGGKLSIENIGRCPLWLGGAPVAQAIVEPGMMLELEGELLLYVVHRPAEMPPLTGWSERDIQPLGEADRCGIVGESPAVWRLRDAVGFVAPRAGHVLILGESGSGKELIARAIHGLSPRAGRPLVARNAATIPHSLMDAELFGHARNYPNAGMAERPGLVGEADTSTLFLDEIGELPAEMQAHLLRIMDHGEYQRLGESQTRRSDLRIIGATNRSHGELKPDFFARFRHLITAPPLDDRREDIPLLIAHLLRRAADEDATLERRFITRDPSGARHPRVSCALVAALLRHPLPLQVRQLDNLLWQALGASPGDTVELNEAIRSASISDEPTPDGATPPDQLAAEQIQACLDKHGGVQAKVVRELGLRDRYVLRRLIAKHGLRVEPEG